MNMIEIVAYRPAWPREFREVAAALRGALGAAAVRIDHIGSTSVPGLAAKDILDVQVTLAGLAHDSVQGLAGLGYEEIHGLRDHEPPGWSGAPADWEKFFFRGPAQSRRVNLHVRAVGRANQRYALLFRDFLRQHPQWAGAYAVLKSKLAAHVPDVGAYCDVKDPVCDMIYFAAEKWAAAHQWSPGSSDA
jgi:GrpB-like predicted nucleotidyltransferase (UPF0157 family)